MKKTIEEQIGRTYGGGAIQGFTADGMGWDADCRDIDTGA